MSRSAQLEVNAHDPAGGWELRADELIGGSLHATGKLRRVPRGRLPAPVADVCVSTYRWLSQRLRYALRSFVTRAEGGPMYSLTLRRIFARYYGVEVGLYTHGGCFVPNNMAPGVTIGRYCSIAITATAFTRNHPTNLRSSHAVFFNSQLGYVPHDLLVRNRLTIGHDVWVGHNAVILPSVSSVGTGAVISANAVINKDIPPYAVVAGNPARIVRYRFSDSVIADLIASRWWERPLEDLLQRMLEFQRPIEDDTVR